MNILISFYKTVKEFFVRYPAVMSGYIIYSYLFISTIKFFLDEKEKSLEAFDIFQRFDSLLWMWLLSVSLVKIIDIRTKLHQHEKEQMMHRQDLEVKKMQLSTLLEIVRGLQHEVNNPLTIIIMTSGKLDRQLVAQPELRESVATIKGAAERISNTLDAFSRAKQYEVDTSPVGNIAKPPDLSEGR
ncbi:MAG TPA: histidine kinase dimerization/phospho-acceptor domain-containing protein [Bacteroidota bacterium]